MAVRRFARRISRLAVSRERSRSFLHQGTKSGAWRRAPGVRCRKGSKSSTMVAHFVGAAYDVVHEFLGTGRNILSKLFHEHLRECLNVPQRSA